MSKNLSVDDKFAIDAASHQLSLQGQVTFATVMTLLQATCEASQDWKHVEFNFQPVTRADSAALAFIMEWIHLAKQEDRSVKFRHLPDNLLAIIDASRLDGLLNSFICN